MIYYKVHAKGANGALCVENGYRQLGPKLRIVGEQWGDVVDCRRCLLVLAQRREGDRERVLRARRARIEESLKKVNALLKAHHKWMAEYGAVGWSRDEARARKLDAETQEAIVAADEALKL